MKHTSSVDFMRRYPPTCGWGQKRARTGCGTGLKIQIRYYSFAADLDLYYIDIFSNYSTECMPDCACAISGKEAIPTMNKTTYALPKHQTSVATWWHPRVKGNIRDLTPTSNDSFHEATSPPDTKYVLPDQIGNESLLCLRLPDHGARPTAYIPEH